jgi:hypothetical protein
MKFLKQILEEKKRVLERKEVRQMAQAHYPELSAKCLVETFQVDKNFMEYLPEIKRLDSKRLPKKDYLWGLIWTLRPDKAQAMIDKARHQRLAKTAVAKETIDISDKMKALLLQHEFTSCKSLGSLALLLFILTNKN